MIIFDNMLRNGVWLRRRKRWLPWVFIISVLVALLITPPFTIIKNTIILTVVSLFLAAMGFIVRYYAIQTRSTIFTDIVEAQGIYSLIRFPQYLSNILIMLALTVYVGIVWYIFFASLVGWLIIERIILNEESALLNKYGDQFLSWSKQTNSLIPNVFSWKEPNYKVSKISALRAMAPYLIFTAVGFCVISLLKNLMIDFAFRIGFIWVIVLIITLALYIFTRRKTV